MVNCMMIHEMIRVFDLERSLKFYDEALGTGEWISLKVNLHWSI